MKSILDWDWQTMAAFGTVVVLVVSSIVAMMRMTLMRSFVSHEDHKQMDTRLRGVESSLLKTASRDDMHALEARLRPVETGVAVANAELKGVTASVQRTEHMVAMLVDHQMGKTKE
jgi:hypothetical protein